MPSPQHETLVQLFREQPALAADLLAQPLGMRLPRWTHARLDSADLPTLVPAEKRADAVVTLTGADGPVLGVVIEVQLRRDPAKRWSWPEYLINLRSRLRCPVMLLVVCPRVATAAWCATPIAVGHPGFALAPLVIGPDQLPVVTDAAQCGRSRSLRCCRR